jgi:hypothetical protein
LWVWAVLVEFACKLRVTLVPTILQAKFASVYKIAEIVRLGVNFEKMTVWKDEKKFTFSNWVRFLKTHDFKDWMLILPNG